MEKVNIFYKYDSHDSKNLQSVAILIMLFHHLFKGVYVSSYSGIPLADTTLEYYIADSFKLCVGIYAFVSGIGAFHTISKCIFRTWLKKRILPLYKKYLIISLFVMIPIACLWCKESFSIFSLLGEISLLWMPYSTAAWYIRFYIIACLLTPLLKKAVDEMPTLFLIMGGGITVIAIIHGKYLGIFTNQITYHISYYVWEIEQYLPVWMTGLFFGKYDILSKILQKLDCGVCCKRLGKIITAFFDILIVVAVCVLREVDFTEGVYFDFIYTPILCIGLIHLCRLLEIYHPVSVSIKILNRDNIILWLLQSLFVHEVMGNDWVYWPQIPCLIFLWILCLFLMFARILNFLFFDRSLFKCLGKDAIS